MTDDKPNSKMKQLLLFAKSAQPRHDSSDDEMVDDQRPSEELAMWLGIDRNRSICDQPSRSDKKIQVICADAIASHYC